MNHDNYVGGRLTKADVLKLVEATNLIANDPLLALNSDEELQAYIQTSLSRLTPQQFATLVKRFYGIKRQQKQKQPTQSGGAPRIDEAVVRLVDTLDTIHDFYDNEAKAVPPSIMNALPPFEIPKGLRDYEMSDEWRVIHFLSHTKRLTFHSKKKGKRVVDNPLYKFAIDTTYEYPNYDNDMDSLYQRQATALNNRLASASEFVHADLHTFASPNRIKQKTLRFASLIDVCRAIEICFGSTADFALDNGHSPVVQLAIRIFKLRSLLEVGFRSHQNWETLQETVHQAIGQQTQITWRSVASDAHVYDSPELDPYAEFDARPTGRVNDSVVLGGGEREKIGVTLGDRRERKLTKVECQTYSRIQNVATNINLFSGYVDPHNPESFEAKEWLDFKRAGDQGQVVNAKRYGRVVVTRDKYLALFAYMHRVPFILVRERQPLFKECVIRSIFTFTMYRG